ncbi:hypothetical protein BDR22DRAFT_395393 [Usnea florida]
MVEDRGGRSMNVTQAHLPDSYSTAHSNLYDEINWLSQADTSSGPTQSSLTTTSSIRPQFRRRQRGQGQNGTQVVRAISSAAPENVLGLAGSIYFDEVGEDVDPTLLETKIKDYEEVQGVLEKRTQSCENLTHHHELLYSTSEANFKINSPTGTVIYGDDARNAILQAEGYRGLFDAAERSTPANLIPESVYETYSSYDMPLDCTTVGAISNKGSPMLVQSSVYDSPPPLGQGSLRSAHGATLDPFHLMAPPPFPQPGQYGSFDDEDALGRSNPPISPISVSRPTSSRASSISPPSIMSQGTPVSCLSTTTDSTPPIEVGLKCPVLGCSHKPFTGRWKKTSLSRHKRQHEEKFICQLGNCRAAIGRSDNRRTHLQNVHPSILLPPKSSSPRVRSEPGGIDEVVERYFTKIKS